MSLVPAPDYAPWQLWWGKSLLDKKYDKIDEFGVRMTESGDSKRTVIVSKNAFEKFIKENAESLGVDGLIEPAENYSLAGVQCNIGGINCDDDEISFEFEPVKLDRRFV